MAWLFERTVEMAAWVAMLVSWIAFGWAIYLLVAWFGVRGDADRAWQVLEQCGLAAATCIGSAVALGALACVDRFLFDADEASR